MEAAKSLNPKPPAYYHYHIGQAYYVLGWINSDTSHYEKAIGHLQQAIVISDNFRPARAYLVAVYIEQSLKKKEEGLTEEAASLELKARAEMARLVSMGRPRNSFEVIRRVAPYKNEEITRRLLKAWELAGG
jgi:tetratricopeptide (TPR) repeat protein